MPEASPQRHTLEPDVDAVVAWVDGSDATHLVQRNNALRSLAGSPSIIPAGTDQTRFESNNEIEYCLRSIRKYAPWIRTIHLVTDQQRPSFLTEEQQRLLGIQLIDHREIFSGYEDVLPTFNSLAIETALHRIPGLSSRYIYLNDDFFLLAPTKIEDFFIKDKVVLRGAWHSLRHYGKARLMFSKVLNHALKRLFGINRAMSVLQQIRGAEIAGAQTKFFKVCHSPYPMKKSTIEKFFSKNKNIFLSNIRHKFRHLDQYAVTSLANHVEILSKRAVLKQASDSVMICFNRDSRRQIKHKIGTLKSPGIKFLCVQSLEQAGDKEKRYLISLLRELTQLQSNAVHAEHTGPAKNLA